MEQKSNSALVNAYTRITGVITLIKDNILDLFTYLQRTRCLYIILL